MNNIRNYLKNPIMNKWNSSDGMHFPPMRWFELLEEKGYQTCSFNHNLPHAEHAWAKENQYHTKTSNHIMEIGAEKIIRFKPNVIFCFAPLSYLSNNFLHEMVASLENKPKLIA